MIYHRPGSGLRQLPWMAKVKVGDVLRSRSGLLRVVRKVSRDNDGTLRFVWFTIRRCSWTKRCYTLYDATTLRHQGYTLVDIPPHIWQSGMDERILQAIEQPAYKPKLLSCCDVRGLP